MNVKEAINKLNIKSTSSVEYAKKYGVFHNRILQYITQIQSDSEDNRQHFVRCYYGSAEEPNVKYIMTSKGVQILDSYALIQPKSIIL